MITVYKKPQCFACTKTIEKFEAAGMAVTIVDVTENADALAYVKDDLGYTGAPSLWCQCMTIGRGSDSTASCE